ncbi:hypothetical protein [Pseudomonas sp. M5]|uniref:hypothetical protein n=1 Tax=Pseudomonas sp. M5 TaxID=1620788 RepID=UPI001956CD42|nr:hypothetical protein [Pseudomonas sp. M5]MBM7396686.1 hypothetical protein [Pseudomonas sp. M5]HDS1758377.1 hypothetical protein [Pseudomonas putida]
MLEQWIDPGCVTVTLKATSSNQTPHGLSPLAQASQRYSKLTKNLEFAGFDQEIAQAYQIFFTPDHPSKLPSKKGLV